MPAPLEGMHVLDLGAFCGQRPHGLAAAMAAKLCLGYGAEVWRPLPDAGEPLAGAAPLLADGSSALDRFLNAGKRLLYPEGRIDLAIGDGPALRRLGAAAPVQGRVSVFGPEEDPPTSELGLLALSGMLGVVRQPGAPPTRLPGHQVAYAAGLAACTGLLAALKSGGSEIVDVSLFDVSAWLNWKVVANAILERPSMLSDWLTLPASDGHVALVYQDKDWPALRRLVGDPRLAEPRFATRRSRSLDRAALLGILAPWFAARSRAEITVQAQALRIPLGPVLWPAELLRDRQHQARGFLGADGMPALPIMWDGQRLREDLSHVA
jgi:hypothetical protein